MRVLRSLPAWKRPVATARRGMPPCPIPRATYTREEWLADAAEWMRPRFGAAGWPLPARYRMSCGWPRGHRAVIGQCWSRACSADDHYEVFVSPELADARRVADVLLHELIHAAVGFEHGHRGDFKLCALALGLKPPMTATTATKRLRIRLHGLVRALGLYPHASLRDTTPEGGPITGGGRTTGPTTGPPKQSSRMLKVECPACGCICRMARRWLADPGPPTCACGGQMMEA